MCIYMYMPQVIEEMLGPGQCERQDMVGYGHKGHPTNSVEDFLSPACTVAGEWLAGKVGTADVRNAP